MKKFKVHVTKLQLLKEKISDLSGAADAAKGGAIGLQTKATYCGYCESDLCSNYCEPTPGDTGCNDCTVCPRTF